MRNYSLKAEKQKYVTLYKTLSRESGQVKSSSNLEQKLKIANSEFAQAKEYITELEAVVEKSRDNIVFLKDLVTGKDEKNKKLTQEVRFYKELSETHIAESSRLAKELVALRSKVNKMVLVEDREKVSI